MCRCEKYRQYFTRDCLMGPNSFRLLDELIRRAPASPCYDRTLDLGCGMALTSVFMANETPAEQVYAFDLWVSATDNYKRIRSLDLENRIIPIHGDAMDMPFAHGFFDAIVSVDSYHYFGCKKGVFATVPWWKGLLEAECGDQCDITVTEGECYDEAWEDWFNTGHPFAVRDREFLSKGLDQILNFVYIYVQRR